MYTRAALTSLFCATAAVILLVALCVGHLDFWNYDTGMTAGTVFLAACLGTFFGAVGGFQEERDTMRYTSNGGCLLYSIGFVGMLIPVAMLDLSGGPGLYLLLPIAGLCVAATGSNSGLTPLLGLGLLAWLVLQHAMTYQWKSLNLAGLYTLMLFFCIFVGCGFLRSRIDWAIAAHKKTPRHRNERRIMTEAEADEANQELAGDRLAPLA